LNITFSASGLGLIERNTFLYVPGMSSNRAFLNPSQKAVNGWI
jgi:hypothetical protein